MSVARSTLNTGKYSAITNYLDSLPPGQATVTLSFQQIQSILGAPLPASAHQYRPWWANQAENTGRPQARSWMDAGFVVDTVNLIAKSVRFSRRQHSSSRVRHSANVVHSPPKRAPQMRPRPTEFIAGTGPRTENKAGAKKIVLIACAAKKLPHKAKASALYVSPLFQGALAYARTLCPDAIYILSAKHGLLEPDVEIEPYDLTLNGLSANQSRQWAAGVLAELSRRADLRKDKFIFLAGNAYRRFLVPAIANWEAPLANLPIGKQLQRLSQLLHD